MIIAITKYKCNNTKYIDTNNAKYNNIILKHYNGNKK